MKPRPPASALVPSAGQVALAGPALSEAPAEGGRCAALAAQVWEAERAAREADAIRREAYAKSKRCSFEAGEARALHRARAVEAECAQDYLREAQRAWCAALVSAYRSWRAAHSGGTERDRERFLEDLATTCGITLRDLLRVIGHHLKTRTPAERDEDFRRYKSGESMRSIARSRGIGDRAVRENIHIRMTEEAARSMRSGLTRHDGRGADEESLGTADSPRSPQYVPTPQAIVDPMSPEMATDDSPQ